MLLSLDIFYNNYLGCSIILFNEFDILGDYSINSYAVDSYKMLYRSINPEDIPERSYLQIFGVLCSTFLLNFGVPELISYFIPGLGPLPNLVCAFLTILINSFILGDLDVSDVKEKLNPFFEYLYNSPYFYEIIGASILLPIFILYPPSQIFMWVGLLALLGIAFPEALGSFLVQGLDLYSFDIFSGVHIGLPGPLPSPAAAYTDIAMNTGVPFRAF